MTSSRSTVASAPPSRSATTHVAWNSARRPDEPAEDEREPERRDDREDQRATGRATAGGGPWRRSGARCAAAAHVSSAASRSARPVRWRNTASRSGSTTSTPPHVRARGLDRVEEPRQQRRARRRRGSRARRSRPPTPATPSTARTARAARRDVAGDREADPVLLADRAPRARGVVPSARISPPSMIPTRSHRRSASSM